jgi:hypothetical protein
MLLLSHTVSYSTDSTYASGWRQWLLYCSKFNLSPLVPAEHVLCGFVAHLASPRLPRFPLGVSVSTVKTYMSSIVYAHSIRGLPSPMTNTPLLHRVMKGHKRWRGAASKQKRPITVGLLRLLSECYNPSSHTHRVVWAVMCIGVHGLARLGELLPRGSRGARMSRVLNVASVAWHSPNHAVIFLSSSKTDPYATGSSINLFATGDITCPIKALNSLTLVNKSLLTPLFALRNGRVISAAYFIRCLRWFIITTESKHHIGLRSHLFAGHSLRRGGATSLANRGVPDHVIQYLGRWLSDTYRRYIDYSSISIAHWLSGMSTSSADSIDLSASLQPTIGSNRWSGIA